MIEFEQITKRLKKGDRIDFPIFNKSDSYREIGFMAFTNNPLNKVMDWTDIYNNHKYLVYKLLDRPFRRSYLVGIKNIVYKL